MVFGDGCLRAVSLLLGFLQILADAAADSARRNRTATRKVMPAKDINTADQLQKVWDFDVRYRTTYYCS